VRIPSKTLLKSAVAAAFAFAAVASAAAAAPVRISRDPYTGTASGQYATEVEPDSFAHGNTMVSAFQVGRYPEGGAANGGWATSTNRGATWTHGFLPGITSAGGGPHGRVSDTAVAYDAKHGVWMIVSLTLVAPPAIRGDSIAVSRSTDGGRTWKNPVTVAIPTGSGSDFDKPWIACDNGSSTSPHYGNCYVQWDDYGQGGLLDMSTSSDGGLHWGAPQRPAGDPTGLGGQPVVQPGGTVIVPYATATENGINSFRSTDGGATWEAPTPIAPPGANHHLVAGEMRAGPLPSAEIDGAGRVYVAWEDCRFRGPSCPNSAPNDIVMSHSDDGLLWSPVVRVPTGGATAQEAFVPGLGVDPSTSGSGAHLALAYHYLPTTNCNPGSCRVHVGLVRSNNAGATWTAPVDISGPMAPVWLAFTSEGYMTGDYISTSFVSGAPHVVFALAHCPSGANLAEAIYEAAPPAPGEKPPTTCPPPPKVKRTLAHLTVRPSKFRATRSGPSIARSGGTLVSYRSSATGNTRFIVRHLVHGHWVTLKGRFWHRDAKGHNQFHFTGHIGGAKLRPGTYRLVAEPRAKQRSAGNKVLVGFKVVPAKQSLQWASHPRRPAQARRTAR
jgi:hypothetical protein